MFMRKVQMRVQQWWIIGKIIGIIISIMVILILQISQFSFLFHIVAGMLK